MIHVHAVQSTVSIFLDTAIVVIAVVFLSWFLTPLIFKDKKKDE